MHRTVVILAAFLLFGSWQAAAQNDDPFQEAAPPAAPSPQPAPRPATRRPAPVPEREPEPVITAPLPAKPNYDGDYVGKVTILPSAPSWCGDPHQKTLSIRDSQFHLLYNRARFEWINGSVDSDGTVSGFGTSASGGNKLTGKIQGDEFIGTMNSYVCAYSLQLKKR